ncbi:MAG TPA: sulfur carrier protein ThiS [Chloroflexota bacterium]|nr:sulfur carrier protein ThiS [Chloroflexota bacterium]
MRLAVNGKPREIDGEQTILQFLAANGVNPLIVAIEHNGEIIRRERFGEVTLREGDTLEIIHVVGGG